MEKPADELPYMSPQCARMLEGVRTGPARGVSGTTQMELQQAFEQQCGEDRREARRRFQLDRSENNKKMQEERQTRELAQVRSKEEEQRLMSQCAEMRLSIARRQSKPDMSDGERHDLALFSERFQQRCKKGAATP
jgi:hypothetical protein